ncbi:MAG TPA: hypothetical protein VE035_18415 [Puia sp.]|nr:hypothetical protein [Puia sp.]
MTTTSGNFPYSFPGRVLGPSMLSILLAAFSFTMVKAQNDPRKSPGPLNVQKVTIVKRPASAITNDSVADVRIDYLKADGTPAVLNLAATYAKAEINKDPVREQKAILFDEESQEKREASAQEVKQIVERIIQNPPPEFLYFVDGIERPVAEIKKLSPDKIKTINVFKHEDATRKYGERAKNGVVELTTH